MTKSTHNLRKKRGKVGDGGEEKAGKLLLWQDFFEVILYTLL
jgi:hypothetical protein